MLSQTFPPRAQTRITPAAGGLVYWIVGALYWAADSALLLAGADILRNSAVQDWIKVLLLLCLTILALVAVCVGMEEPGGVPIRTKVWHLLRRIGAKRLLSFLLLGFLIHLALGALRAALLPMAAHGPFAYVMSESISRSVRVLTYVWILIAFGLLAKSANVPRGSPKVSRSPGTEPEL